eukprot:jgi/Chrzof1/8019/UNPLg00071.t1
MGLTTPTNNLPHGVDPKQYYHIPKHLARRYFGLAAEDFVIGNIHRNQPRKQWPICIQAFAKVVAKHVGEPIKLLIGTALNGGHNLIEIYMRELTKHGLTLEQGLRHIVVLDHPQELSDFEINVLNNAVDVCINTCDGEGWGLCNYEAAAAGIPQIVPRIGGFLEFLDDTCSTLIDPKWTCYLDSGRDSVGGEAEICSYEDFARAIES